MGGGGRRRAGLTLFDLVNVLGFSVDDSVDDDFTGHGWRSGFGGFGWGSELFGSLV